MQGSSAAGSGIQAHHQPQPPQARDQRGAQCTGCQTLNVEVQHTNGSCWEFFFVLLNRWAYVNSCVLHPFSSLLIQFSSVAQPVPADLGLGEISTLPLFYRQVPMRSQFYLQEKTSSQNIPKMLQIKHEIDNIKHNIKNTHNLIFKKQSGFSKETPTSLLHCTSAFNFANRGMV